MLRYSNGVFVIFFSHLQKDFLHKLPIYANFIERNNIEFGILLCSELYDNALDGITYKESKEFSSVLDVIELDRKRDNDDEEEQCAADSHHDPLGYDEVLQTIRAIIWSNVDMKRKIPQPKLHRKDRAEAAESDADQKPIDSVALEAELSGFEQLLTEVMTFKETTASWSRNERLAYAEKFAGEFPSIVFKHQTEKNQNKLRIFFSRLISVAFDNLLQNKSLDNDSSDSDSDVNDK